MSNSTMSRTVPPTMALINWVSHHIFVVFLNLLDITRLNKMNPSQMQQEQL